MNLGAAYQSLNQYQKASDYYQQALSIYQAVGDRDREGLLLANIGRLYVLQDDYQSATTTLLQSVKVRETIRQGMRQLDPALQQSYRNTLADDYVLLAELLKQQNRDAEAQQVLELLN
jgi:tetratricopeptide (TPR) repeat protein